MSKNKARKRRSKKATAWLQQLQGTPLGENMARNRNYWVRRRRFEQIMLQKLGSGWEEMVGCGRAFVEKHHRCFMAMLERLDRAGRLTDELAPELVRAAVRDAMNRCEAGCQAGKAWAAEHPAPKKKKDFVAVLTRLSSSALFGTEMARFFDVERQYAQNGDAWLAGFGDGVMKVWCPIRA